MHPGGKKMDNRGFKPSWEKMREYIGMSDQTEKTIFWTGAIA
jgi:hypothetical protein